MANIEITQVDTGSVEIEGGKFQDELITFTGADTLAAGTILARDSVSGKLVVYAIGGVTNENGVPKAVLTYPVVAAGAGDEPARVLVAGRVNATRLVVDADGDASNITAAILDELRSYGIVALDVEQLGAADNE